MRSGLRETAEERGRVWSSLLEAFRRRRSSPEARLAGIGLSKGMRVADVGSGYGFFAFPAADLVGEEGAVYAIEPNPKRAEEISKRASERGVKNLKVVVSGAEDMGDVGTGEADFAISISSFHHFADAGKALLEIRRIVRQGGRVYIRDIKAGRVFEHGSVPEEFRAAVSLQFPDAEFEEGRGYLVAKVRL